jgi:hypothetical protein
MLRHKGPARPTPTEPCREVNIIAPFTDDFSDEMTLGI